MQLTGENSFSVTTSGPPQLSKVFKNTGKAVVNMGKVLSSFGSNVSNVSNAPSVASPRYARC